MGKLACWWWGRMWRLLVLVAGIYAGGFVLFLSLLPTPLVGMPAVDGLVVFTGGEGRVRTAMGLVADGFGGPVLVSGVHPMVHMRELEGAGNLTDPQLARVMLDKESATTRQNVRNTLRWADTWHLDKVGVVTSTYHAPRVTMLAWLAGAHGRVRVLPVQPLRSRLRDLVWEYSKLWVLPLAP